MLAKLLIAAEEADAGFHLPSLGMIMVRHHRQSQDFVTCHRRVNVAGDINLYHAEIRPHYYIAFADRRQDRAS